MTTIIGIQGDGFCVAVADSRISDVEESGLISQIVGLKESNSKLDKITNLRKSIVFGSCFCGFITFVTF